MFQLDCYSANAFSEKPNKQNAKKHMNKPPLCDGEKNTTEIMGYKIQDILNHYKDDWNV